MIEQALKLNNLGLKVCFTKDPSKPGGKAPIGFWRDFIDGEQTAKDIQKLYDYAKQKDNNLGLAIICSNGLEVLDIDSKYFLDHHSISFVYDAIIEAVGVDIFDSLVMVETISGGYHLVFKSDVKANNQKLASRYTTNEEKAKDYNDKQKVLLETRAHGGIFLAAPTAGYKFDNIAKDYSTIPTISKEERDAIISVCRSFDEIKETFKQTKAPTPIEISGNGKSTIEAFNESHTPIEFLENEGWQFKYQRGTNLHYVRPGKTLREGIGAGYCEELNLVRIFTSSSQFECNKTYNAFQVFAFLNENGDYKKAWRTLYDAGYGERLKKTSHNDKVKLITTQDMTMGKKGDNTAFLDSIFNERIDITVKEVQKPNTLFIRDEKKQKYIGLGGYGDIVNIFGAGKSRKTGIAIAAASCFLKGGSGESLLFKGDYDGKKIVHFDTEQSRHYTQVAAKEIVYQSGLPQTHHPENFLCFPIKKLTKIDRLNFIKHVMFNKVDNIGCILLDGVVDICRNYNDLEESSDLVTFLLNTAENAKFLLLDILHNAQSTGRAKGHLGQELINKATANLNVVAEEDKDFSSFKVMSKRGEFTDASFDFWYNTEGHIDLY
jgi:hypothetical protein